MDGKTPNGPVVVFDDHHYYMGGVIAEKLRDQGLEVTLVTPAPLVSSWTVNTLEQSRIQKRLLDKGVSIMANQALTGFSSGEVTLSCAFSGRKTVVPASSAVLVTSRTSHDGLHQELAAKGDLVQEAGIKSVSLIGDSLAPGTIAAAVFSGHRHAREFEKQDSDEIPFLRELAELGPWSRCD